MRRSERHDRKKRKGIRAAAGALVYPAVRRRSTRDLRHGFATLRAQVTATALRIADNTSRCRRPESYLIGRKFA